MTVWISALEPSADRWAGSLARAIRELSPDVGVSGVSGGTSEGNESPFLQAPPAAMGFWDPVVRLPRYLEFLNRAVRCCRDQKPDVVVVFDSPAFHLPFLRRVAMDVPVVYFSPPQVWAWRQNRARKVARLCTHVVTLFDWEREWFSPYMAADRVIWFGHPSADETSVPEQPFRGDHLLALPGSRRSEIRRLAPLFAEVAERAGMRAIFRAGDGVAAQWIRESLSGTVGEGSEVVTTPLGETWSRARACLACAGTVTLEAACAGLPTVVAYRTDPPTYWIARRLIQTEWIALPNIMLGTEAYPECVQGKAIPGTVTRAIVEAMAKPADFWRDCAHLLVSQLGTPGVIGRLARIVIDLGAGEKASGVRT